MTPMAQIRSLCVYCGASDRGRESHRDAAIRFGAILANAGVRLIFGGGRVGLMGMMADSALQAGGEVVGIIPRFLDQVEVGHTACTRLIVTANMHERKEKMAELSDGFVILPGGLGTLDETFEILTWKQLQLHDKPIVVADVDGFWGPLVGLIDNLVAENYAHAENRALFSVVDTVEDVLPTLEAMPDPVMEVDTGRM